MTFDRLQHESNEARYSPLIKINGETKVYDPVENNDFWWHKKSEGSFGEADTQEDVKMAQNEIRAFENDYLQQTQNQHCIANR